MKASATLKSDSRKLLSIFAISTLFFIFGYNLKAIAQSVKPQGQPRRTTHVTIQDKPEPKSPPASSAAGPANATKKEADPVAPTDDEATKRRAAEEAAAKKKKADEDEARLRAAEEAAKKRDEEERLAAKAALEREREEAAREADRRARQEMEAKIKLERADRDEAEKRAVEERARLEAESKKREEIARAAAELAEKKAAEEKALAEQERKQREEAEASAKLARESLVREAHEREAKIESERLAASTALAETQKRQKRTDEIVATARKMNFRDPSASVSLVPDNATDYRSALIDAVKRDASLVRVVTSITGTFCDTEFTGRALTFDFPGDSTTLGFILNYIRSNTEINFMPDADVEDIPVKVNVTRVPWNVVLRNLLDYNDLESNCASGGVVQIVRRAKLTSIQENRRKSAPLEEEYIPLRYLQVTQQVTVNLAGKANNPSGGSYQSLEDAINKIIQRGGDQRAYVSRVPNRNELFVTAPADVMASIKRLIAKADRESYVVIVHASTYSADESRLKDIGLQTALTLSDAAGMNLGGFSTLPQGQGTTGTQGTTLTQSTQTGGLNRGGIPSLPRGFTQPTGGLGAVTPASVLGGTGLFGTFQFAVQLTALQQRGIVNVQQRPALLVNNGDTGVLDFGRTIAVAVQAIGTGGIATGQLELLNAGSTLSVTPQVAEDDQGNPAFVTLDVRLEGNDVDTSVSTSVAPSIDRRAIQTRFVMGNKQTVVFSAFSTDSVTKQKAKTPILGDIPGVGALFRRALDQVSRSRTYFTLSVEIVRQSQITNVAEPPADSSPAPVPPPAPQKPSPFGDKEKNKPLN